MTVKQLFDLEDVLKKQHPGWRVARGGIITPEAATGVQGVICSAPHLDNKTFVVDFDTMTLVGAQG